MAAQRVGVDPVRVSLQFFSSPGETFSVFLPWLLAAKTIKLAALGSFFFFERKSGII